MFYYFFPLCVSDIALIKNQQISLHFEMHHSGLNISVWLEGIITIHVYCLTSFCFIGNNSSTNYRRYLYTTQNQIVFVIVVMLDYFVNFICTFFMPELNQLAYVDLRGFDKIQCGNF